MTRAGTLREAVEAVGGGAAGAYRTPYGEVQVGSITVTEEGVVEVRLMGETEGGDPSFRIVNPPLLVPDPAGDVSTSAGPMRLDPIAAVVYVVGSLGGAIRDKGRRAR